MKYVAFLRAINVGGHAIIKMADLKKMFEAAGLENVQTYIQSGNVIFESEKEAGTLEKLLAHQLEKAAAYDIEVFVRTFRDLQTIVKKSPFTAKGEEAVFVTFHHTKLTKAQQDALSSLTNDADDFALKGREVYHLRRDRETSVLSRKPLEKILKISSTTRNLATLAKMIEEFQRAA